MGEQSDRTARGSDTATQAGQGSCVCTRTATHEAHLDLVPRPCPWTLYLDLVPQGRRQGVVHVTVDGPALDQLLVEILLGEELGDGLGGRRRPASTHRAFRQAAHLGQATVGFEGGVAVAAAAVGEWVGGEGAGGAGEVHAGAGGRKGGVEWVGRMDGKDGKEGGREG